MRKEILLAWAFCVGVFLSLFVIGGPEAQPVKPPIPGVAGPTTAEQFYSITPDVMFRRYTERVISPAPAITAGVLTIDLTLGNIAVVLNSASITSSSIGPLL